MFRSIFNNIDSLRKGNDLPMDSTQNLLKVFQTTSVETFNDLFDSMEKQLINTEIQMAVDPNYVLYLTSIGGNVLKNDLRSVMRVLETAEVAYRNLLQKGDWDKVMQQTPGKAAFFQGQTGVFNPPSGNAGNNDAASTFPKGSCFNCGGPHHLSACPIPKDRDRIAANRAAHPNGSGPRNRPIPHKWRTPEDQEQNKRVIDGKPYTWDPNGGFSSNGRWILDDTPTSGETPSSAPASSAALTQVPTLVPTEDTSVANGSLGSLTAAFNETSSSPKISRSSSHSKIE